MRHVRTAPLFCLPVIGVIAAGCGSRRADAVIDDPILPVPMARWSFDEGTGMLAHDDLEPHYDGALFGGTWIDDGRRGGALRLERGDWVRVDPFALTSADWSVSLWVRLSIGDVDAGSWRTLLSTEIWTSAGPTFASNGGWELHVASSSGSRFHFEFTGIVDAGLGGARRTRCCELELERWYHLVGVFDASSRRMKLYEGGLLQDQTDVPGPVRAGDSTLYIGRSYVDAQGRGADRMFSGVIDEVTLYDHALGDADVLRLQNWRGP